MREPSNPVPEDIPDMTWSGLAVLALLMLAAACVGALLAMAYVSWGGL